MKPIWYFVGLLLLSMGAIIMLTGSIPSFQSTGVSNNTRAFAAQSLAGWRHDFVGIDLSTSQQEKNS